MSFLVADFIVIIHFGFILFVAGGGFLLLRWPRLVWLHLPCVAWGVAVEITGWICPLTPLENHLRHAGGDPGYTGDFIDRYLMPIIYPAGLTRTTQIMLGITVLLLNIAVYTLAWRRRRTPRP